MTDLSDTESESSVSETGWDAVDFMQLAVELGRIDETAPDPLKLREALEILRSLDICVVEHDERLHETIRQISNTVSAFLDSVVSPEDPHLEEMQADLLAILNESCMTLLLEYRVLFRAIASRSIDESTTSIPVCWVDVILAKLGYAVVYAAGIFHGIRPVDQNQPDAIRAQKGDDMLRAAVQLPAAWPDIQHVLSSEYASPAAVRLAFSLIWGMTVMAESLAEDDIVVLYRTKEDLFQVLQKRVKRRSRSAHGMDVAPIDVDEHERITCAMLVSLYAFADPVGLTVAESPCRPQTHATLLEMVQLTLSPEATSSASCHIRPAVELDVPRAILVKWGRTLPWSWRVWQDPRLYQSEVVECLTSTWLHHLDASAADIPEGHSVEWWDDQMVVALECDPRSALSMMSRILLAILTCRDPAAALRESSIIDVVLKTCWSVKHLLQLTPVDDDTSFPLYGILYKLYLLLCDTEPELAAKDLIIEVLSLSLGSIRLALTPLGDPRSQCTLAWERKLSHQIKILLAVSYSTRDISMLELRSMRQTLQLLALLWRAGCTPLPSPETMTRRLLSALLDWLESDSLDSLAWYMLGDTTIVAHAMSLRCAIEPEVDLRAEFIWGLVQDAQPTDLSLAASLAAYIVATVGNRAVGSLAYAEAWNYLRDVMLLILNREFGGAEEPLALLVCPSICRALVALVQHAPARARAYYLTSPWTGCMLMHMKHVADEGEETDAYAEMLQELISPYSKTLCSLLEETPAKARSKAKVRHPEESGDLSEDLTAPELTFCWHESQACLLPS